MMKFHFKEINMSKEYFDYYGDNNWEPPAERPPSPPPPTPQASEEPAVTHFDYYGDSNWEPPAYEEPTADSWDGRGEQSAPTTMTWVERLEFQRGNSPSRGKR